MIDKEKLKDWLLEQLGTKDQERLRDDDKSDLRSRVIHRSRLTDIATRTLWQLVANAFQAIIQRGGIPPASSAAFKQRAARGRNGFVRALQMLAAEHYRDGAQQSERGRFAGSVTTGEGKAGVKPIYMADLGFYGYGHPWHLACSNNPRGRGASGVGLRAFYLRTLTDALGNQYEFTHELDDKPKASDYSWADTIRIWPPRPNPEDEEDALGVTRSYTPQFAMIRYRRTDQKDEDSPNKGKGSVSTISSILVGNGPGQLTQAEWNLFQDGVLRPDLNDLSQALVEGTYANNPTSNEFSSQLSNGQLEIVSKDFPHELGTKALEVIEARMLPAMRLKPTAPRSTVIPGQSTQMPRISGAYGTKIFPDMFGTISQPDTIELGNIDLAQFVKGWISQVNLSLASETGAMASTAPKLSTDTDNRRRRAISCFSSVTIRAETFALFNKFSEFAESACFETEDNAERRVVKKVSRRNNPKKGT